MADIRYIKRQELDVVKWDHCIDTSPNGLIYAYSFYLDAMCDKWDALILGDYEAVMPLPWRKKWGVKYIYQPFFLNALGLFSPKTENCQTSAFITAIPKKFKYWDMDFNEANKLPDFLKKAANRFKVKTRNNYWLQLHHPYTFLYQNYLRLAKRKLKKAQSQGLIISRDINPQDIIYEYAVNYAQNHAEVTEDAYQNLLLFCTNNARHIKTYQAKFHTGETAAFYLLLQDTRYIYSLLGGSTTKGKGAGAFYLLTDAAIKDHANSNRVFRFEGSDKPGIAFFNQQFGSYLVEYQYLNYNGLPWPFKLLKR